MSLEMYCTPIDRLDVSKRVHFSIPLDDISTEEHLQEGKRLFGGKCSERQNMSIPFACYIAIENRWKTIDSYTDIYIFRFQINPEEDKLEDAMQGDKFLVLEDCIFLNRSNMEKFERHSDVDLTVIFRHGKLIGFAFSLGPLGSIQAGKEAETERPEGFVTQLH